MKRETKKKVDNMGYDNYPLSNLLLRYGGVGSYHTVNKFDAEYFVSLEQNEDDTINLCAIPGYVDMIRQKAFLSSQLKMAETDSIGLLINVRDSVIQLLIKGLPVRTVSIDEYDVSPFFHRANQEAIYSMLSAPMTITGIQATFRKDPVNVKIAPKDTTELSLTEA